MNDNFHDSRTIWSRELRCKLNNFLIGSLDIIISKKEKVLYPNAIAFRCTINLHFSESTLFSAECSPKTILNEHDLLKLDLNQSNWCLNIFTLKTNFIFLNFTQKLHFLSLLLKRKIDSNLKQPSTILLHKPHFLHPNLILNVLNGFPKIPLDIYTGEKR